MDDQTVLNIIPEPKVVYLESKKNGWVPKANGRSALEVAGDLVELFNRQQHQPVKTFGIPITLKSLDESRLKAAAPIGFSHKEGYILFSGESGVTVAADRQLGIFYGLQTLGQIIAQFDGQPLPALTLFDWPSLTLRGQHVCYAHVAEFMPYSAPSFEALLDMVSMLAHYKVNLLLLEIEAMFPYRKYPEISCEIAFTREQIEELRDVCRRNNVQIMPLLQCLGHAYAVLRHPRFAYLRELPGTTQQYCPLNPEARVLYFELVDEILEAFPETRYFHVGGDESRRLGQCKKCREVAARDGLGALYGSHIGAVCSELLSRDITPVVWGDMMEHYPDALKFIPEKAVIDYWNYNPWGSSRRGGLDPFPPSRPIIVSPGVRFGKGNHTMYLYPQAMRGISTITHEGIRRGTLGMVVTDWMKAVPWELSWVGRLYAAELGWGTIHGQADFERKFTKLHFGVDDTSFLRSYALLSEPFPYCEDAVLHQVDFWDRYDMSGLSGRERILKFTNQSKRVETVAALEHVLNRGREALMLLKEVSSKAVENRREYDLLVLSARTNIHKAEMGLAFDRSVRLLKYPMRGDEKQREEVASVLKRLIEEWKELRKETAELLRLGTFTPVVDRMLDVKFEPDVLWWMKRFLDLLVLGQVEPNLFKPP
ncbi:MAG: beta-N-acetylhexosaminidase [Candidatus Bathyarchaeota archaeon]|nr:beta-N-acetylhexosaminidase [Candidatus Bathyarchaeota archaeon]